VRRACRCVGLSRAAWYKPIKDWRAHDRAVIDALSMLAEAKPGLGFWKLFGRLRRQGYRWNHKRVYRVYCRLGLNRRRRARKRIPSRSPLPLGVPYKPNAVWSADFMSDGLYNGTRFRTFNVLDCVFQTNPATDSTAKLPPFPFESCHPFQGILPPADGVVFRSN